MKARYLITMIGVIGLLLVTTVGPAAAVGTAGSATAGSAFTYQGKLEKNGTPFTGACDFTFGLWDTQSAGSQIGANETLTAVAVVDGVFTVKLNDAGQFGASAFDGSARYLEIRVKCPGDAELVTLGRQELTSTPYASYALSAGSVSGVIPVANGGTGSATQNFVDLSTDQDIMGIKTFYKAPGFSTGSPSYTAAPFTVGGFSTLKVDNLNADMLDGQHASAFQRHVQNVIVVAKGGGDFTTIGAAIASIPTSGAGVPSSSNHYLIWVAPGTYSEEVVMKNYVDIEGAGEKATKITFGGVNATYDHATLVGASEAELRFLTVESTGNHFDAVGIYSSANTNFFVTQVTVNVSGAVASYDNLGMYCKNVTKVFLNGVKINVDDANENSFGILTDATYNEISLEQVTVHTQSPLDADGLKIFGGRITITDSYLQAYNGVHVFGVFASSSSTVWIDLSMDRSAIQAGAGTNQYPLYLNGSHVNAYIGGSRLAYGTVYQNSIGNFACVDDYNGSYVALNSTCQ